MLIAVSGGKDSLAAWDLLLDLEYECDGLYLGLGISGRAGGGGSDTVEYSKTSGEYTREFAQTRGAKLIEIDLPADVGFDIPGAAAAVRRAPCGVCGLSKRHLFNRAAMDGGYDVVATGHNLDDEAAVLLGNVLRWDGPYLGRQYPVLPAAPGFVRKVKPLVRLTEREMAAYCVLRGIDYIVDECPMAEGNRHLAYKDMLNDLELRSPGAKASFLFSFWERGWPHFSGDADTERVDLRPCTVCGSPTPDEVCAFCRLTERVTKPKAG